MQNQVKIGYILLMLYIIYIFKCIFDEMQTISVRLTLVEHKIIHTSLQQSGLISLRDFQAIGRFCMCNLKTF